MSKSKSASAQTAQSQSKEFRAGAVASLTALRAIERIVDRYRNGAVDSKSYFRDRELIREAMISHAGPASPFLTGFITALAEYIDTCMQENSGINLRLWNPEAAMTASEVREERARIFGDEEAMDMIISSQGELA